MTERDLQRIPNDGNVIQSSFSINGNALTSFPNYGEKSRNIFNITFSFSEENDTGFILQNFPFKHSVLGGSVEAIDVPGDDIHGIPWEDVEKNSVR